METQFKALSSQLKGKFVIDFSFYLLLFVNLLTIVFTLTQGWNVATVLMIYLVQSLIIGAFNVKRILSLDRFSTENFQINGQPATPTKKTQAFTAGFFAFHFGFFHFVYIIFIFGRGIPDWRAVLAAGIPFLVNHYYSHRKHLAEDKKFVKNIGKLMFRPYLRIFPMHLTIIFGSLLSGTFSLLLFMILKTIVDLLSHLIKHRMTPPSNPINLEAVTLAL